MKKQSKVVAPAQKQTKQQPVVKEQPKKEGKKEAKKETKKDGKKPGKQQAVAPPVIAPQPKEEEKLPAVTAIKEIKLTQIQDEIDNNYFADKSSFVQDLTSQFEVFLKYKGEVIDFPTFILEEKMNRVKKEDFVETVRKSMVRALRQGTTIGFLVGLSKINFQEFWKGIEFFEMEKIFNPQEVKKEEFYKKKILKPEEDVDGFGNKGYFHMNDQFRVCIITKNENLEEIKDALKLPNHLFNFFKVIQ